MDVVAVVDVAAADPAVGLVVTELTPSYAS